jgi:hypothetical protein
VRDDLGAPFGWDLAFLAFGVALIVAGTARPNRQRRRPEPALEPFEPSER